VAKKIDDELVKNVLRSHIKQLGFTGKESYGSYEEFSAELDARIEARKIADEATAKDFGLPTRSQIIEVRRNNRRIARKKQIWINTVAVAMSAVLIFSLIGIILYFNIRGDDDEVFNIPEDNLIMTVIDYDTLQEQGFFVPNISSLDNVIIRRADDRVSGTTKLFVIMGDFDGSRMTMRIIFHEIFEPSDMSYFQSGSLIDVGEYTVRVSNTQYNDEYIYRMLFIQDTKTYYIEFTTQNRGEYLLLLNTLFSVTIENKPNPPDGDTVKTEIKIDELPTTTLNFDGLDDMTARRVDHRETENTIMFIIEGYFGDSHMTMRMIVDSEYIPSDASYFGGGNMLQVNDRFVRANITQNGDNYIHRFIFLEDMKWCYVELVSLDSNEYLPFLYDIFQQ